jgi:hypothetical protein
MTTVLMSLRKSSVVMLNQTTTTKTPSCQPADRVTETVTALVTVTVTTAMAGLVKKSLRTLARILKMTVLGKCRPEKNGVFVDLTHPTHTLMHTHTHTHAVEDLACRVLECNKRVLQEIQVFDVENSKKLDARSMLSCFLFSTSLLPASLFSLISINVSPSSHLFHLRILPTRVPLYNIHNTQRFLELDRLYYENRLEELSLMADVAGLQRDHSSAKLNEGDLEKIVGMKSFSFFLVFAPLYFVACPFCDIKLIYILTIHCKYTCRFYEKA